MGKSIVDELVTLFTFETNDKSKKESKAFSLNLKNIRKFALVASAALTSLGVTSILVARSIDMQGKFAGSLNVSTDALQELEFATQNAGGTSEDLDGSLKHLNSTLNSAMVSGQFSEAIGQIRANMKKANGEFKSSAELLIDISVAMQKYSAQKQVAFGEKLGLSLPVIRLLQKGPTQIRALMIEARRVGAVKTPDMFKNAAKFDSAWLDLKSTLKGTGQELVGMMLPKLTELVTVFDKITIGINKTIAALGIFSKSGKSAPSESLRIIKLGVLARLSANKEAKKLAAKAESGGKKLIKKHIGGRGSLLNKFQESFGSNVIADTNFPTNKSGAVANTSAVNMKNRAQINHISIPRMQQQTVPIMSAGAHKTSTNVTNNNTINVNGAKSPTAVANEVGRHLGLNAAAQTGGPGFNRPAVA